MHIEETRCVCDECDELKPHSIIIATSDGNCSLQLCTECARSTMNLLKNTLKENDK